MLDKMHRWANMVKVLPIGDLESHPEEMEDELGPHTGLLNLGWTSCG